MHPAYSVWAGMKRRCNNPNSDNYRLYGGRGIRICESWNSFTNFIADMGERPPGTELDRIDPDGNYEPGNCRWATRTRQMRNTRQSLFVVYGGETLPLSDLAERFGLDKKTLKARILNGWPEAHWNSPPEKRWRDFSGKSPRILRAQR